jgi:hypothetical protein
MDDDEIREANRDPKRVHGADQLWAEASIHLDKIIAYVRTQESDIYTEAGGNHDPSVLYDWMKGYIMAAEVSGGRAARHMTLLMAAASITRLTRAPRVDDPLAQLDKELGHDDHNH